MANVKGSALASRLLWVRINQGEQGIDRLKIDASPELADLLERGAVMSKWYPFELFINLNETIDRVFGKGDLALIREIARHGADANLTTIYRLFYKVGTVKWIMARASRLWGLHYDSGSLEMDAEPGKSVLAEIHGFATPHVIHCMAVRSWAERSVELSGGRDVAIDDLSCRARGDERCTFRVEWS